MEYNGKLIAKNYMCKPYRRGENEESIHAHTSCFSVVSLREPNGSCKD